MPCQIICKINVNVVSKRPDKNGAPLYKFALLNVCPERYGEIQRQVIGFIWKEKKFFREFERALVFDAEEEAFAYAHINHVPMAYLKDNPEKVEYAFDLRENGILPTDFRSDLVILEIEKRLPNDWELIEKEPTPEGLIVLTIQAKFTVWELWENKINTPAHNRTPAEEMTRIKQYGKEVRPQITFTLHQPWRTIELKAVSMVKGSIGESVLDRFYRNSQYFGLKAVNYKGMEGFFHSVAYAAKQPTTYQVYEIVRDGLEPLTVSGKALNAKMGAMLQTDKGEVYFMHNQPTWEANQLNKQITIKGLLITKTSHQPLVNDKGEYSAGAEGTTNYLVKPPAPRRGN